MKIINFKSEPKKSPFAPEWDYFLAEQKIENVDFKKLFLFLKEKEKSILKIKIDKRKKNVDGYTGLGDNSTTSRYGQYNVFNWKNKELIKLKQSIIKLHNNYLNYLSIKPSKNVFISCWFNVIKKNQRINTHLHGVNPDSYLSGNICVSTEGTSTYYINPVNVINDPVVYKSKNEEGKITLFPSKIPHYTDVYLGRKDRLTIAFDLFLVSNRNKVVKLI
tara:strand:- start:72 stop:728 length:657 start_codon:yes stop_codon:yes gene_type:complete